MVGNLTMMELSVEVDFALAVGDLPKKERRCQFSHSAYRLKGSQVSRKSWYLIKVVV
jgi:hypothetical protein